MAETYEFPTPLHSLANKHYGHFPDGTVANVNFILFHIDGEKLNTLYNTYSNGTQFTRGAQIEEQWNKWYTEYEEQLSGLQMDILLFLLNMYGCQKARKGRVQKFKHKGKV